MTIKNVLKSLWDGNDCFVCQPTGSGKSIIYQSFPFFTHLMASTTTTTAEENTETEEEEEEEPSHTDTKNIIYIYLKIEYQSETNFIYHENLRFKKKEKSLRKIKESKRMTKTQGNIYKVTKQSAYSGKKKVA